MCSEDVCIAHMHAHSACVCAMLSHDMQLIVTRHHLILTCSDTGILTHLYKQQLSQLDQEAYHAHLRYVPFDLSLRLPGDKDLDYFVTKAREGDVTGDRCAVGALKLAVNELDEKHVGVFSFRSREGIYKVGVAT